MSHLAINNRQNRQSRMYAAMEAATRSFRNITSCYSTRTRVEKKAAHAKDQEMSAVNKLNIFGGNGGIFGGNGGNVGG